MTGAREEVGDQNDVIAGVIELAVGFPTHRDVGDRLAAMGSEAVHFEGLFLDDPIPGPQGRSKKEAKAGTERCREQRVSCRCHRVALP